MSRFSDLWGRSAARLSRLSLPSWLDAGRPEVRRHLYILACALLLAMPLIQTLGRSEGDVLLSLIAVLFLYDSYGRRSWRWMLTPHTAAALALWLWMVGCSVVMGGVASAFQAVALLRFFVFLAALETWVLADRRMRRALHGVVIITALWIVAESFQQRLTGTNVFGYPMFQGDTPTGPFLRPQAGPMLLLLFFPTVLPVALYLIDQPRRLLRVLALLPLGIALVVMVMINQRMPVVLAVAGLCLAAVLYPRFRLPVAVTIGVAAVFLALLPLVSPPTFAKMVVRFSQQVSHFWTSDYGLLFARAVVMIQAHPWTGLGWDGFRNHCMDAAYLMQPSWLPAGDPTNPFGCSIHPHNYWTQIGTTGGLPAMALFALMIGLWLWHMARGGAFRRNARLGALLIFTVVSMWPIASTTSLFTVPNAGYTFLMIGWGLAEALAARSDGTEPAGA